MCTDRHKGLHTHLILVGSLEKVLPRILQEEKKYLEKPPLTHHICTQQVRTKRSTSGQGRDTTLVSVYL